MHKVCIFVIFLCILVYCTITLFIFGFIKGKCITVYSWVHLICSTILMIFRCTKYLHIILILFLLFIKINSYYFVIYSASIKINVNECIVDYKALFSSHLQKCKILRINLANLKY